MTEHAAETDLVQISAILEFDNGGAWLWARFYIQGREACGTLWSPQYLNSGKTFSTPGEALDYALKHAAQRALSR